MQNMHEIITIEQFNRLVLAFAGGWLVLATLVGLVAGLLRRRVGPLALRGLAVGLFGPLTLGLWRLYSHLIRYDPQTGFCGLHRISVLFGSLALFVAVGIALGLICGRLWRPSCSCNSGLNDAGSVEQREAPHV